MATKSQQRDSLPALDQSPVTSGDQGSRFMYAIGLGLDLLLEKQNQAQLAHMPGEGPPSSLPLLAADRVLSQGIGERNAAFELRLSEAFEAWSVAGSRRAVLEQVQAYFSSQNGLYAAQLPECLIVGGNGSTSTWDTIYTTMPQGAIPAHAAVSPRNFNWDGTSKPSRAWLVLFMSLLPTGLSGSGASIAVGSPLTGSLLGQLVNGIWVPGTSGIPVNSPFWIVNGLSGLTAANNQQYLTLSGSGASANNGTWQIVQIQSANSCIIANPNATITGGTMTWSIGHYPIIGPSPVLGSPGFNWGDGETLVPPIDTGATRNGVWQPAPTAVSYGVTRSWGLSCATGIVAGVRSLLRLWKQAGTYYPHVIVAFDGADSSTGSAFSPNSAQGSGNPDGTFGSPGRLVNGVWMPARLVSSVFDCYCDGTGAYSQSSVHTVT